MSLCGSRLLTSVTVCMIFIMVSNGQFPMECMDAESLQTRECCPNNCGDRRGTCVNINVPVPTEFDNSTVRDNWPYYFTNLCRCNGNYAGFDCSRCKYGYYGDDCSQKMVLPRRQISDLNTTEWQDYINILKASKTYNSGYFVFLEEPNAAGVDLTTLNKATNVKLYDLFIWQHHYAAKDNELDIDYAHESTGFPTWHRQYLLWLEWELQYMMKESQPDNYHTFRLHYWDWRKNKQTNANSPFKSNRLGVTMNTGGRPRVQGDLVTDNDWQTRCWRLEPGSICDPNENTGPLQRCPFTGDPCSINNPHWPSDAQVYTAVTRSPYDDGSYNKSSKTGFRNYMEGFDVLNDDNAGRQSCSENQLCICNTGGPQCEGSQASGPIARLLHNSIHIILGIGHFEHRLQPEEKGVMADVAAASSDPIFINHHAMVDCILEKWLQRNPNAQYPQNNQIHEGHKADDYTVPFFPLVKHREMFMTADNFGYSCDLEVDEPSPPNNRPSAAIKPRPALWLLICVVFGVGILFI